MPTNNLSARQKKILAFIGKFLGEKFYPPTIRASPQPQL
ncbi:MAG: hypothetical protein K8S97_06790 [Anaerolineae bacterium]|nr:hypothetical protein [Anaerolineae bacterium]